MDFENNNNEPIIPNEDVNTTNEDTNNEDDFEIELQGEPTIVTPNNDTPDFSAWSNPNGDAHEEPATEHDDVIVTDGEEVQPPYTPYVNNNINNAEPHTHHGKGHHKKNVFMRTIGCAVIFGVIASLIFVGSNFTYSKLSGQNSAVTTGNSKSVNFSGDVSDTDLSGIVEAAMPSIVSITNKSTVTSQVFLWQYQQEQVGAGSGIIYGKNDTELLIVTNYHVVSDSEELKVYFNDVDVSKLVDGSGQVDDSNVKSYIATVKDYDEDLDLAVISIKLADLGNDVLDNIVYATPGDSASMKAGQRVIAIGNALGYGQSVTTGIISATNRSITMQNDDGTTSSHSYIQTDAAINPGNSGGALLNMNGELIGINSAKIAQSGVEGMGYAIPISDVKDIIGEMLTTTTKETVPEDQQGTLGIAGSTVSSEASKAYNIPVGVSVQEVYDGMAASKAGIKKGFVITAIAGKKVTTMEALQKQLTFYKAGETVELTVQVPDNEGYVEKKIKVTLDTKDSLEKAAGTSGDSGNQQQSQDGSQGQQSPFTFGN